MVLLSCALTRYTSIFLSDLEILESTLTNLKKTTESPSKSPVTVAVDASSLPTKTFQCLELSFLLNHLKIAQ